MADIEKLKNFISPHKEPDKQFFMDLLDMDKQVEYENTHIAAVMATLKGLYLKKLQDKEKAAKAEKEELRTGPDYNAEKYRRTLELDEEIAKVRAKMREYKPFFDEPYFARMDLTDPIEGYNSYYIGKRGDEGLEIVDWRAPLARRYYQKSRTSFSINEYDYKLILRRAVHTHSGKVTEIRNEYLSVDDYLSKEEIAGRDETLIFDPFLREILESRREKQEITDIIETIQEKQYEVITLPDKDEFVLQGVAGAGKTMVLLHRLSYIMYNNESIHPTDVLVITPSDSFNAFIDELSEILELEKVRTSTLDNYFGMVLKNAGVEIEDKIDSHLHVSADYLTYLYSNDFMEDIDSKLAKIYDGVFGIFSAPECRDMVDGVMRACDEQCAEYDRIKNSSVRVRRCVLGEIKERAGSLYYTKRFRNMFNCVQDIREFLGLIFTDERMKGYAYFYRELFSFYKSIRYIASNSGKICAEAMTDLQTLRSNVEKEIADLKRYKIRDFGVEQYLYADGIEKREALVKEIGSALIWVQAIADKFAPALDFAYVLKGMKDLVAIGKSEGTIDVLRFFYRELVRPLKIKYGVVTKPLIKSDLYALVLILTKLGYDLLPKYAYLFIDEAQDISEPEYYILKTINTRAVFNVFGDLKQNITPFRGLKSWDLLGFTVYNLDINYRNTNNIVNFVSENLGVQMLPTGFDGEPVKYLPSRGITSYLSGKKGLKAIICSADNLEALSRTTYNILRKTGKVSKDKINLMTVYESKGLEFSTVAVYDADLTDNEKYIAYTRALKELVIICDTAPKPAPADKTDS
ncbi:MAG: UvrD-helicase domain-containing protein [Clostridia bacterium]|nr:UvrD-helicase domain-containing protein [Clostridia bacterium]